jgi:hypothetical protein
MEKKSQRRKEKKRMSEPKEATRKSIKTKRLIIITTRRGRGSRWRRRSTDNPEGNTRRLLCSTGKKETKKD